MVFFHDTLAGVCEGRTLEAFTLSSQVVVGMVLGVWKMKTRVLLLALAIGFGSIVIGVTLHLLTGGRLPGLSKKAAVSKAQATPIAKKIEQVSTPQEEVSTAEPMPETLGVKDSLNLWGVRLFRTVSQAKRERNTVLFPAVNAQTLAILGLGSSGRCQYELSRFTGFSGRTVDSVNSELSALLSNQGTKEFQVTINSSLWTPKDFQPNAEFKGQARSLFRAETKELPRERPAAAVNAHFLKTCGLGNVVNESQLRNVRLLVTSASRIEGSFVSRFGKASPREFTRSDGQVTNPPSMSGQKFVNFRDGRDTSWSGVALQAHGGAHLCVLLPQTGRSLSQLIAELRPADIEGLLDEEQVSVRVSLPKVKLGNSVDLAPACQRLGLKRIFESRKDDLSFRRMSQEDLYVGFYTQKAELEVDEGGFRGRAADAAGVIGRGVQKSKIFNCNRPYLLAVVNKERLIIALAAVENPQAPE